MKQELLHSKKTLPYILLLWSLFGLFGYVGIFHFERSSQGVVPLPVTPGEVVGIYLAENAIDSDRIMEPDSAKDFFQPLVEPTPAITGTDRIHLWLRLPLTNSGQEAKTYTLQVDYRWIHLVNFYTLDPNGRWQVQTRGQATKIGQTARNDVVPTFKFSLAPGESQVFYLQMRDALWLEPSITLWDDPQSYADIYASQQRYLYIYLGLVTGLFLTNFCVYIAFRYKDLRYYLFYLGGTLLFHLVNMNYGVAELHSFFHTSRILFDGNLSYFLYSSLLVTNGGLLLLFAVEFLGLSKSAPVLFKQIQRVILAILVIGPFIAFGPVHIFGALLPKFVALTWIASNLLVVLLAIYGLCRRIQQAHYLLAAVLLLLIVSWRFNHAIFTNSTVSAEILKQWLFASCLEMMVLVFGLVDRFLHVNNEKQEARAQAINAMSTRVELQENFNQALSRTVEERTESLNTANKQKDRLLAFLAHDIRTPLSSLVSLSSMLGRMPRGISHVNIQRYATEIEASARGISELMENLLSWGQLQTQQLQLKPQEFLVDDLYEAAYRIVKTQADLRAIRIQFDADKELYCDCDFTSIVAVLRNLISNAVKFSPDGAEVAVGAHACGQEVVFSVRNDGSKVAAETLRAINSHEAPEQSTGFGGEPGAGLGLPICFSLLEIHETRLIAKKTNCTQGLDVIELSFSLRRTE